MAAGVLGRAEMADPQAPGRAEMQAAESKEFLGGPKGVYFDFEHV
jgi:hypothetical protein